MMQKLIISLTFFCFPTFYLFSQTIVKYELQNIKSITPSKDFTTPVLSPDGKNILFTTVGLDGIYLYNAKDKTIKNINKLNGAGYNASWAKDSKNIFYRNKQVLNSKKTEINSYNIENRKSYRHENINPDALLSSILADKTNDPVVYTNTKTLQIEAQLLDKSKSWNVTNDDGQYYQAILSQDKKKVIVHKGGEMFIYAIDGSGLLNSLGRGIACNWSFDDKKVLFFQSEDNGHEITGSDLYIHEIINGKNWKITNTKNVYESWPSWSADNKKITYSDEKSGKIYLANIIEK